MSNRNGNLEINKIIRKINEGKLFLIKLLMLSFILGLIFSISISNKYTSSTVFIPQILSEKNISAQSSLSGLASLAGINIDSNRGNNSIPPSLYPQIISSTDYKLELISNEINYKNEVVKIRDYLLKEKNIIDAFLSKIFTTDNEVIKNSKNIIYEISEEDHKIFNILRDNLSLKINIKEGFISLSYTDSDKQVSAEITRIAQEILQEKIIDYKVKASKELLDFTQEQYDNKKILYDDLLDKKAIFQDKNLNISSSLYSNKLERLESELSIARTVVEDLANQLENVKLQVNKDTPVITIISKVTIPYEKDSPNRIAIILIFIFIGTFLGLTKIFWVDQKLLNFKNN